MILSYLMSFLYARSLLLKQGFAAKHPGSWLVWEPGNWHVPGPQANAATTVPNRHTPAQPQGGDALCFELKIPANKEALSVGRDSKNDIAINDATVSREQLLLYPDGPGWLVLPMSGEKPVLLNGSPLAVNAKAPLASGAALSLGAARLSFYSPQAFLARLATSA